MATALHRDLEPDLTDPEKKYIHGPGYRPADATALASISTQRGGDLAYQVDTGVEYYWDAVSSTWKTTGGVASHAALTNLAWASSGHTGTVSTLAGFDGSGAAAFVALPVSIANGGTGQITNTLAFNALSPLTMLGDIIYHDGTNNFRLAGNSGTSKTFLSQTGTGSVSAAPVWSLLNLTDIPAHNLLSTTHGDTAAASVSRGDLITGQTATPKWTRLAIGVANRVLRSDGTDVAWAQVALATDVSGDLPYANLAQGSGLSVLGVTGTAAADVASMVGTAGQVLFVNAAGTALAFGALDTALGYVKGVSSVTANYLTCFDGTTGKLVLARGIAVTEDAATVAMNVVATKNFTFATTSGGNQTWTSAGNLDFYATAGQISFYQGANLITAIGSYPQHYTSHLFASVAAPGTPGAGSVQIYKKTGVANAFCFIGEDGLEKQFRLETTLSWYAGEVEEVDADWAITANAQYSKATAEGNLYEVDFPYTPEQAFGLSFPCPSWATRVKFKFMHRTETSPGGSPSSWTPRYYVRTISDGGDWSAWSAAANFTALTLPASTTNWQFDEQTITLATLGITAGQDVQMTISRLASTGLNSLVCVRRISLEFS